MRTINCHRVGGWPKPAIPHHQRDGAHSQRDKDYGFLPERVTERACPEIAEDIAIDILRARAIQSDQAPIASGLGAQVAAGVGDRCRTGIIVAGAQDAAPGGLVTYRFVPQLLAFFLGVSMQ